MGASTADHPDLGLVFDAHVAAEFVDLDVDATMATMSDAPHLIHLPALTGGHGRENVSRFYASYFVGRWPKDTKIQQVSRTVGAERVVDELIMSFTHDVSMPAILPGVSPTGRRVELAVVVIVGFKDGKVAYEHIYWDQASLLVQLGLLERGSLPVCGAEQARSLLDPDCPMNELIRRSE